VARKILAAVAAASLLAGCTHHERPAAEATPTRSPHINRLPNPAISGACDLITPATLAQTFGSPAPRPSGRDTDGRFSCQYQWDADHSLELSLDGVASVADTPEQVAKRAIVPGTDMGPVPGLGDAGMYSVSDLGLAGTTGMVVATVYLGDRIRVISLVSTGFPNPKEKLVALVRIVLDET
jgi:hypothetical protein